MRVKDFMSTDLHCCTPEMSLRAAARMMCEFDCGGLPVVDANHRHKPIGIITDRDLACRAVAQGKDPERTKVAECMSQPSAAVDADSSLEECCDAMERIKVRRMLVVDEHGDLCGIVAQADVALRTRDDLTLEMVREVSLPTPEPSSVW
jgi:CBS domain-containing protein